MYFHHANAVGLAGEISRPIRHTIPAQAATALPPTGGVASAKIENFALENVLSFRRAAVQVAGSFDSVHRTHTTMALATLEDLNVLDVITADKIVARLSATQSPRAAEPHVVSTASYFENLRIAGQPVQVKLAKEVLNQYGTFEQFHDALKGSKSDISRYLVGSCLPDIALPDHPSLQHLQRMLKKQANHQGGNDFYWATLVDRVQSEVDSEVRNYGSIILIPEFGVIHLAELLVQRGQRRLNMLRLELGSPVGGSIAACCASCGGLAGDSTLDD